MNYKQMIFPTILVAVCLLSSTFAAPQMSKVGRQKLKETMTAMMAECKEKAGASDEDLKSLRDRKMPTTKAGQCMVECFLEKAKFMKDGKFDKIGALEAAMLAAKGDVTKIGKLRQLMEICDGEIKKSKESDKCKIAKKVVECTVKRGNEYGFELPHDM